MLVCFERRFIRKTFVPVLDSRLLGKFISYMKKHWKSILMEKEWWSDLGSNGRML